MWISPETKYDTFELDEIYWFLKQKERTETRENTYIMTMISRFPRQIVGINTDNAVKSSAIQTIVDSVPVAKKYCTDGCLIYLDVDFGGKHIRNVRNKTDTHNIESINADLRHYIPGLARRSRCFYRTFETMEAVLAVFVDAYNKFGEAKSKYQIAVNHKLTNTSKYLHKYRDLPFSILDFI